ncbi:hypothetical protein NL676_032869 [Syzygium grande]|nr:hypothetical protein NL676_032869 [Syzygium grande]
MTSAWSVGQALRAWARVRCVDAIARRRLISRWAELERCREGASSTEEQNHRTLITQCAPGNAGAHPSRLETQDPGATHIDNTCYSLEASNNNDNNNKETERTEEEEEEEGMVRCVTDTARGLACRDSAAATHLKLISILVIFVTSVVGISSPVLLARYFRGKPAYDKAVLAIKCFAAGVILSTSLVHVLPDAFDALSDCAVASRHPWKDFPFAGLVTLFGALLALFVDITASSHVEHGSQAPYKPIGTHEEKKLAELGVVESAELGASCGADQAEELVKLKQKLVSQVLEMELYSTR